MTTGAAADAVDEQRLLLSRDFDSSATDHDVSSPANRGDKRVSSFYILVILLAQILAFQLSNTLMEPAMASIEEAVICREHFSNVTITNPAKDPRCKSESVQSELSMLQGLEMTFSLIPGLLTSVAYGIAAEKYGRRPILIICTFGMMLAYPLDLVVLRWFPVKLIWFVPVVYFIGGGLHVLLALIYTIASDVTSPAQRSTVYFYVSASLAGTWLLGNPLAYLAMKYGPWTTGCLACLCFAVPFILALIIPETSHIKRLHDGNSDNDDATRPGSISHSATPSKPRWAIILSSTTAEIASLRSALQNNANLALLLSSTLLTKLGSWVSTLLMLFISKRFSFSWAEAQLVLSVKAFSKLVLVLLVLPLISQTLIQAEVSPPRKDLLLARYCIVLAALGAFGIAFSPSVVILMVCLVPFALSEGFDASIRSLIVQRATANGQVAIIFAVVSLLENLGIMVAGPGMAYAFRIGLGLGQQWYGLPFIVAGVLMMTAAVIVLSLRADDEHVPTSLEDPNATDPDQV
ncbi:hypothetical protein QQS21_005995 [Conoideocrella luteorostrata]|uniref:Major facilitator superfamily (MFS) profile domain-containing protein n=1 Tax=Conoideocrella luteorostrata TaxID=1105319 RepID=A0AAJ0CNP0_9HYPO|nr:hypothetical protein QQS21_005995 [Conoideocrella luteorostrata]